MTVEHVQTRPTRPAWATGTRPTDGDAVAPDDQRPLASLLESGGAVIGCLTGWVVVVGIFIGAVAIGTICIGGTAAMLAAAFLAP
ncbi:hypothetical protein [Plantibacter sp. MMLR14_011]|uniref:hypothetical protein n=1 Tax=Plantibacter sp. MMLR14_011 TaxID=1898746 RepID=UPI0008DD45EA|nr:hypothetical protein [Plantibacter sp. MMLR14_011]OII38824.1 hypothetical protein BIU99_09855 [Plantibacter sp. MMLR14_011]